MLAMLADTAAEGQDGAKELGQQQSQWDGWDVPGIPIWMPDSSSSGCHKNSELM